MEKMETKHKLGGKIYKIDNLYAVAIFDRNNTFAFGNIFESAETAEKYCEDWCGVFWGVGMKYDKIKHYLYNAIDYMLQAGESEQYICEYLGMSDKELTNLLENFEIGE